MEMFEHNNKIIHFYIDYDYSKPRGKVQTMILFLEGFFGKNNSLKIPINGFIKDFETDESKIEFIEKNIKTIENWMNIPKEKTNSIKCNF